MLIRLAYVVYWAGYGALVLGVLFGTAILLFAETRTRLDDGMLSLAIGVGSWLFGRAVLYIIAAK